MYLNRCGYDLALGDGCMIWSSHSGNLNGDRCGRKEPTLNINTKTERAIIQQKVL